MLQLASQRAVAIAASCRHAEFETCFAMLHLRTSCHAVPQRHFTAASVKVEAGLAWQL